MASGEREQDPFTVPGSPHAAPRCITVAFAVQRNDRDAARAPRSCGGSSAGTGEPVPAWRRYCLAVQPSSLKLPMRVCQPARLLSWPANV